MISPLDTFRGFHKLGFGLVLSLVAMLVIHGNFSYPTGRTLLPDPLFRIHVANIHRDKHGSDSGAYDTEGRFVPQKFEDMFEKYARGREYMTLWDVVALLRGQRLIADPVGWGGAFFECKFMVRGMFLSQALLADYRGDAGLATYLMLWPQDGRMMKEDIRRIYDGSIFYTIADRRAKK